MDNFQPLDLQTWPMSQSFYYYTQIAPTGYTVNVMVDVTILKRELKKRKLKFFPAYLYVVFKAITKQKELRIDMKDEVLGVWDFLSPVYPQFHEDDKTTSLLWTEYNDDFDIFYHRYLSDTNQYGKSHGILSSKGVPKPNSFVISCIPWFTFRSFSVHNHGMKDYYFPTFEAGKFIEKDDKFYMPLSITVHHATVEGYHVTCSHHLLH